MFAGRTSASGRAGPAGDPNPDRAGLGAASETSAGRCSGAASRLPRDGGGDVPPAPVNVGDGVDGRERRRRGCGSRGAVAPYFVAQRSGAL